MIAMSANQLSLFSGTCGSSPNRRHGRGSLPGCVLLVGASRKGTETGRGSYLLAFLANE